MRELQEQEAKEDVRNRTCENCGCRFSNPTFLYEYDQPQAHVRCEGCGFGGAIIYRSSWEVKKTVGPVFEPGRYLGTRMDKEARHQNLEFAGVSA